MWKPDSNYRDLVISKYVQKKKQIKTTCFYNSIGNKNKAKKKKGILHNNKFCFYHF